jgi:ADP-heptose:LPS heptosyltransferase
VYHVQQWSGTDEDAEPAIDGVDRSPVSTPYILVHPGASWRYKQWSSANMARLVRWLGAEGCQVKVVAGPNERSVVEGICAACEPKLSVIYPTLNELYALVAGAEVVICNNSAALHIAEALGTPCIALTGPSDPVRWGTYRAHSRTVTRSRGLPCHPCDEKRCVRPATPCIDRIELVDVIETLNDLGLLATQRGRVPISL